MGEMADMALGDVEDEEEARLNWRRGGMTPAEAYDRGVIDDLGYEIGPQKTKGGAKMKTETQVPAVAEVPKLPPTPVFEEQIETFLAQVAGYTQCTNAEEFELAKRLGSAGTDLKKQIESAYAELKRAIDAYKLPVLDAERRDLARVKGAIAGVDAVAIPWQREQDRLAQEEANKRRDEEIKRREEAQRKEAELLKDWEPEKAAEIASKPVEAPRAATVTSGFAYRRGAARKPKLKAKIVQPDAVKREFCSPDTMKINHKIDGYTKFVKDPTPEVLKKWADEIGGVVLEWE